MTLTDFFVYAMHRRQMRYNEKDYSPEYYHGKWEHTDFGRATHIRYVGQRYPEDRIQVGGIPGLTAGTNISIDDWDGTINQMAMGASIRYNEENGTVVLHHDEIPDWSVIAGLSTQRRLAGSGEDYDSYPVL